MTRSLILHSVFCHRPAWVIFDKRKIFVEALYEGGNNPQIITGTLLCFTKATTFVYWDEVTLHKIKHFKVNNSLAFSAFAMLQPPPLSNAKAFSSPQRKSRSHWVVASRHSPFSSPPSPWQPLVSVDSLFCIFYKCGIRICALSCLAFFFFLLSIRFSRFI